MFVHGYSWVETNGQPSACILSTFPCSRNSPTAGDHGRARRMPDITLGGYPEDRAIGGNATAAILKGAGERVAAIVG